ncbi:single-strand DNA-binding protein [Profundibacterium mesophilum KAUST100406-0324]|uniref:Single-strand DNA-binding protein n=2 Tax=Profundibacterium TaxID=1258570 RepID=A0A921NU13_9RHOB|nr:single-strand DNA-binding protein [Profundibacterium mesophilum KAUST100406-0324]
MSTMSKHSSDDATATRRRPRFRRLRANFLTGLVVIAPIFLTVWLIYGVVGWIDGWVLPLVPARFRPEQYIGINLRGVGVIIFLIFTVIIGWLAKGLIGRSLLRWGESLVNRMPVVRTIYSSVKQLAETVFAQSESSFEKACLIEYPRRGIWAIAFISTSAKGEIARSIPVEEQKLSIFLPTTPNPTSGFLLFLPRSEVIELDMSVEDAAKLVISAGLVYPGTKESAVADAELAAHSRAAE